MPKKAREMVALEVKRLDKPGFYPVGGVAGLALQVTATGARTWILRAMVGGKRRDIGLGGYPDVTLADARERARRDRDAIREGRDPAAERKAARDALKAAVANAMTFAEAARKRHAIKSQEFRNKKHRADWLSSLEIYAFPAIGDKPVDQVDRSDVLRILDPIWRTKTETATRLRGRIEDVLNWAAVNGYREGENPARWKGNLDASLPAAAKVQKRGSFPALPWQRMGEFIQDLRERDGTSARALEFAILTGARSREVRGAKWSEIDREAKVWTIPADRIKAGKQHRVPLSDAAMSILNRLPETGSPLVFPSPRGKELSDMALSQLCRRMGYTDDAGSLIVPHGFRSSFKDWARNCQASVPDEVSELALAHVNSDATRAAYARDELLPQRTAMMRAWAIHCSQARRASPVTPIRSAETTS